VRIPHGTAAVNGELGSYVRIRTATGRDAGKADRERRAVSQKTCMNAHYEQPTAIGGVRSENRNRKGGLAGRFLLAGEVG
jgi:hypothetical protein